jgi:hypothetical protein
VAHPSHDAKGGAYVFFHRFPQFFRILPLPQTLFFLQLGPHCVNPATSIRITNKLSLTRINYRATVPFDSSRPSSPMECGGLPPLFLLPRHPVYLECRRAAHHSSTFGRSNLQTFRRSYFHYAPAFPQFSLLLASPRRTPSQSRL